MAAAAQAFDTGAYPTVESHRVTNAAGGDGWDQLSTVAGAHMYVKGLNDFTAQQ